MNIVEFIDERLDSMLTQPSNWGDSEAFEFQVLLLLEIKQFMTNPVPSAQSLRTFQRDYSQFLRTHWPDVGSRPLFTVLGEDMNALAGCLEQYRDSIIMAPQPPAPSPPPSAPEALGSDVMVDAVKRQQPA